MEQLKVSFIASPYDQNAHTYDFSVTIQAEEVSQVILFGVNLSQYDGYNFSSPANFKPFVNPNMPPEGEVDDFKTSWIVSSNIFTGKGSKVKGFVALPPTETSVLQSIDWFAYVIMDGITLQRIEGQATAG